MVASLDKFEFFEQSKKFFEEGNITNSLESFQKVMEHVDRSQIKKKTEYIQFLQSILKHCQEQNLLEQEALALRALGRIHSLFKNHVESMKYHYKSLKIQKKLGKKQETAQGLEFLAEDIEVSGNYEKCISTFQEASQIYQDLGKLKKVEEIQKELSRLQEFSREMVEDEFLLNKFQVDKY